MSVHDMYREVSRSLAYDAAFHEVSTADVDII